MQSFFIIYRFPFPDALEATGHFDILTVINHETLAFWHFNLQHPLCLCQMQIMLGGAEQPAGKCISVS
jgi:hypothetical protein